MVTHVDITCVSSQQPVNLRREATDSGSRVSDMSVYGPIGLGGPGDERFPQEQRRVGRPPARAESSLRQPPASTPPAAAKPAALDPSPLKRRRPQPTRLARAHDASLAEILPGKGDGNHQRAFHAHCHQATLAQRGNNSIRARRLDRDRHPPRQRSGQPVRRRRALAHPRRPKQTGTHSAERQNQHSRPLHAPRAASSSGNDDRHRSNP